jgi:hypothetical protein
MIMPYNIRLIYWKVTVFRGDHTMNNRTETGQSFIIHNKNFSIYLICWFLVVVIVLLDFSFPMGVSMCVLYIMVVMISLWSPQKRFTVSMAVVCSVFTIGAFFFKPGTAEIWKVIINRVLALFAIWLITSLGLERKAIEEKQIMALAAKEKALEEVRVLRGLLPVCASCKKIRDDKGLWTQMERYIKAHSEADFTHCICPECAEKLYSEYYNQKG